MGNFLILCAWRWLAIFAMSADFCPTLISSRWEEDTSSVWHVVCWVRKKAVGNNTFSSYSTYTTDRKSSRLTICRFFARYWICTCLKMNEKESELKAMKWIIFLIRATRVLIIGEGGWKLAWEWRVFFLKVTRVRMKRNWKASKYYVVFEGKPPGHCV